MAFSAYRSDKDAATRLLNIALDVKDPENVPTQDKVEYDLLRRYFMGKWKYSGKLPGEIVQATTLSSYYSRMIRQFSDIDLRRNTISTSFLTLLSLSRTEADAPIDLGDVLANVDQTDPVTASDWTGIESRRERLVAARALLPMAQSAVEDLIAALELRGHNGGPLLENVQEAVDDLRHLHRTLGEIIEAIDGERFNDDLGDGLMAEAVRWTGRVRDNIKDDPAPFAAATLLMVIFASLGFPAFGGLAATIAFQARKKAGGQTKASETKD